MMKGQLITGTPRAKAGTGEADRIQGGRKVDSIGFRWCARCNVR